MTFIPWIEVEHANGDTTYLAALAITTVNDDHKNNVREVYTTNSQVVIKTKVSANEIFDRMSTAIKGAHDAEMDVLYPKQAGESPKGTWARQQEDAVSQRDTSGDVANTLADSDWLPE